MVSVFRINTSDEKHNSHIRTQGFLTWDFDPYRAFGLFASELRFATAMLFIALRKDVA